MSRPRLESIRLEYGCHSGRFDLPAGRPSGGDRGPQRIRQDHAPRGLSPGPVRVQPAQGGRQAPAGPPSAVVRPAGRGGGVAHRGRRKSDRGAPRFRDRRGRGPQRGDRTGGVPRGRQSGRRPQREPTFPGAAPGVDRFRNAGSVPRHGLDRPGRTGRHQAGRRASAGRGGYASPGRGRPRRAARGLRGADPGADRAGRASQEPIARAGRPARSAGMGRPPARSGPGREGAEATPPRAGRARCGLQVDGAGGRDRPARSRLSADHRAADASRRAA